MPNKTLEKKARHLHTHLVVFDQRDYEGSEAAIMALQGKTTKAIAKELGISESRAQYRITKAQNRLGMKFRNDYRNGSSPLAKAMANFTHSMAQKFVYKEIAPHFAPFASSRLQQ